MLWSSNKVFRNYLKLLISNLILECVSKTIVNWNVSLLQHYTKSFDKFNLNGNKAKEWIISLIVLKTLSSVNSLIFIIWTSLVTSVIILKIDFSRLNRDFNDLGNSSVPFKQATREPPWPSPGLRSRPPSIFVHSNRRGLHINHRLGVLYKYEKINPARRGIVPN